jgi:hypothetical protein
LLGLQLVQVRRDSMDVLVAKAQEPEAGGLAQLLVQGLAHIPGWDDKNFQVGPRSSWVGHTA